MRKITYTLYLKWSPEESFIELINKIKKLVNITLISQTEINFINYFLKLDSFQSNRLVLDRYKAHEWEKLHTHYIWNDRWEGSFIELINKIKKLVNPNIILVCQTEINFYKLFFKINIRLVLDRYKAYGWEKNYTRITFEMTARRWRAFLASIVHPSRRREKGIAFRLTFEKRNETLPNWKPRPDRWRME